MQREALSMRFPLIYLHIPKTAGTSFRISAEHYFGPSNVLNDYGENSPATSQDILDAFYSKQDEKLLREKGLSKKFLTGHFTLAKYREVFPDSPVVTFFREPVARVISEYMHFVSHYSFEGSLQEFYGRKQFQNQQARALSGALPTDLDFYGFTESYSDSLDRFNIRYGTKFPVATLNQGKYNGGTLDLATPAEVEEIRELNGEDLRIYEYAVEHYDQQDDTPRVALNSMERFCGFLGGLRDEKMFGWTVDRQSEKPATISVAVNGVRRCVDVADKFREDIRRKGIHINGHCGFEIPLMKLGRLSPGDVISVSVVDGDFELSNSPLKMP